MAIQMTDSTVLEEDGRCAAGDDTSSNDSQQHNVYAVGERRPSLSAEEAAAVESVTTHADQQQQMHKVKDVSEEPTRWQRVMASPYLFALLPVAAGISVAFQAGI